jgi:hypothetical protein
MQNIKLSISEFGFKLVEKGYVTGEGPSPAVYDF